MRDAKKEKLYQSNAAIILFALFFFFFPAKSSAVSPPSGCCELPKKDATNCSEAACLTSCFPMPSLELCKKNFPTAVWKDGNCSAQSECAGKAPSGCCLGKDLCLVGQSSAQCYAFDNAHYAATTCSSSANSEICKGRIFDEAFLLNKKSAEAGVTDSPGITVTPKVITPALSVKIPSLSFSQLTVRDEGGVKYIDVPFLAQYIQGIYNYVLVLVTVLATAMVAWGGIKWLSAGGNASQVDSALTTITNALIGLLLALGTYFILNTINPELINLRKLRIETVQRITYGDVSSYMAGSSEAASTLAEVGIQPGGGGITLKHTIPLDCPNRDPKIDTGPLILGNTRLYPKSRLAFCPAGKSDCLTQQTINQYINEQNKTGVPAAVLMAQMLTESWNKCVLLNLFNNPKSCGGIAAKNLNFGGIGCTQYQVPKDTCPHIAFTQGGFNVKTKEKVPLSCNIFNKYLDKCVEICKQAGDDWEKARNDSGYNCGGCVPWKSHASTIVGGQEIWIPSIQCSKKFDTVDAFLKYHLGFVKPCLPYNDSVYKFAYCIGASTYAGVTGSKGQMLAEIIERNCLCDPETDSTKCQRNKELEEKLSKNVIKKRNLFLLYKEGKPDYDAIVKALAETTGGLLTPTTAASEQLPQNDIIPPPDF